MSFQGVYTVTHCYCKHGQSDSHYQDAQLFSHALGSVPNFLECHSKSKKCEKLEKIYNFLPNIGRIRSMFNLFLSPVTCLKFCRISAVLSVFCLVLKKYFLDFKQNFTFLLMVETLFSLLLKTMTSRYFF